MYKSKLTNNDVYRHLENALTNFVETEKTLLVQDTKEESISNALIPCLRKEFDFWKYNIDHQNNRRILAGQAITKIADFLYYELPPSKIPKKQKNDLIIRKRILPDIIFHNRESPEFNFLVIEIKKSTNTDKIDRDYDISKLEYLTSNEYFYSYGAFIDISTGKDIGLKKPFQIILYEGRF